MPSMTTDCATRQETVTSNLFIGGLRKICRRISGPGANTGCKNPSCWIRR